LQAIEQKSTAAALDKLSRIGEDAMTLSREKQIVGLLAWLLATFVAAAIGGAASIQAGEFYRQLIRPE